jgi:hypothetical protein
MILDFNQAGPVEDLCHVAPPSCERQIPSSPPARTVPPAWASTENTRFCVLPPFAGRVGSSCMWVHVTPRSSLIASPQSVPTKTRFVSGENEMPWAAMTSPQRLPSAAREPAGMVQVDPPSVLRQMPVSPILNRPPVVAITTSGFPGAYATSRAR